ncbi:hypothetical protein [Micromonospora sp. 15K316]|uniref:hypothetical protein n=1 Tax=Micromonospora sp. 15K316 TaxID=2530376 RepID=UPI001404DF5A|nr:hypothetical protein [Micromonospora sp. 15K316]
MHKASMAALTGVALVLAAGSPALAGTPRPRITIEHRASELYLFQPPFHEESYPATGVDGLVRHCPSGNYLLSASLEQDGLPTLWATSGRGAGEVRCDGGEAVLSMAFTRLDPLLHPGRATVRFALRDAYTSEQLTETTRTVRIPC